MQQEPVKVLYENQWIEGVFRVEELLNWGIGS